MKYQGSCHCGKVAFEVDGELNQVMECNCSICSRLGSLLWFVPRDNLKLLTPAQHLSSYSFGARTVKHHFCPSCGVHPFGEGSDPAGNPMAAVNVRCLEAVDLSTLSIEHFDGRSL